jgi:hypothetical protein
MEYQVPQFIEVESKIVGPLTFRQFLYIAGAAGMCVILFTYVSILFAVLLSIPIVGFAAALAFYKVNGKPFIEVLEAGLNYYTGAKLLLWKHDEPKATEQGAAAAAAATAEIAHAAQAGTPRLTRGKLSELAWSLDVSSQSTSSSELEK